MEITLFWYISFHFEQDPWSKEFDSQHLVNIDLHVHINEVDFSLGTQNLINIKRENSFLAPFVETKEL